MNTISFCFGMAVGAVLMALFVFFAYLSATKSINDLEDEE